MGLALWSDTVIWKWYWKVDFWIDCCRCDFSMRCVCVSLGVYLLAFLWALRSPPLFAITQYDARHSVFERMHVSGYTKIRALDYQQLATCSFNLSYG